MGYTYYNPLKVWLDPASIADVVSYMQKYLSENPIKDTEEINQIIADYIAAHPEIIGGVQSVNGETGVVVLTASDIETTGQITIQAVLTSLSSQISDIAQTVTQNTNDITDLKSNLDDIESLSDTIYTFNWEQGMIDDSGVESSSDYRVRTIGYTPTTISPVVIGTTTKRLFTYIRYYDATYTYKASDNDILDENPITIDTTYPYYRLIVLDYTNSSYSEPISSSTVEGLYTVTYTTKIVEQFNLTINNLVRNCINPHWEMGNISSGADAVSSYRVRTKDYISCTDYPIVSISNSGHRYFTYVFYYNSSKVYQIREDYTSVTTADVDYEVKINQSYAYYRIAVLDYKNSSYSEPITAESVANAYILYALNPIIKDLQDSVSALEEGVQAIPSYFDSQVSSVSGNIDSHSELVGKDGISFIFCTDIHWDQNQKHSPALISHIAKNTLIDLTILGGDYITQFASSKQTAINTMRACIGAFYSADKELYPIFGNHDRNSNGDSTPSSVYMTKAETYSIINAWMPQRAKYSDEYFDFYLDDNKSKTRFVCLDTGAQNIDGSVIDSTSLDWCESVINELSADWHIIVVAHWLFNVSAWDHPLVDGVLTGNYTSSAIALFTALDSFNSDASKPTVEAIITGHVHCDYVDSTTGGIPIIYTDTDSMGANGDYSATAGTVSEQCFDVVTVDYTAKKIYCDRIGRGVSRTVTY